MFDGKHRARLRKHRVEPRMIFRWDPAPEAIHDGRSEIDYTATVRPGAEAQPSDPLKKVVGVKKGDCLFVSRCMDVYN